MYKLEFLPSARQDLVEIVRYISRDLSAPEAADKLAMDLIGATAQLETFPYAFPSYTPIRPLKHEYRKLTVRSYLMFYWIEEEEKTVTVARVVYGRRDYQKAL